METISLKLKLMKPTHAKEQIYCKMTELNTGFSNWLFQYDELSKATSKVYKLFSADKFIVFQRKRGCFYSKNIFFKEKNFRKK